MDFTQICWLIVKIAAGLIVLFFTLGLIAKAIAAKRDKKYDLGDKHD